MGFNKTLIGYHIEDGGRVYHYNEPVTGMSFKKCELCFKNTATSSLPSSEISTDTSAFNLDTYVGSGEKIDIYEDAFDQILNDYWTYYDPTARTTEPADPWTYVGIISNAFQSMSNQLSFSEKSWPITSETGNPILYAGGFYEYGTSVSNFSTPVNFGEANNAYAAHIILVVGGPYSTDTTYHVSGTRISDTGTRTANYDATITVPSGTAVSTFFETPEKFLGQVTIAKATGDNVNCCYGWAKYWDNNNSDFTIVALESLWLGGANDAAFNVELLHHKSTGWTYQPGGTPTEPTPVAAMATDHVTERNAVNGEYGAWKRSNLNTFVEGGAMEGTIVRVSSGSSRVIVEGSGNFMLRIKS